jgi:predicted dehydrogenase
MTFRIGIIGVGAITTQHVQAIRQHPGYEIAAVCRRSAAELEKTAKELGCRGFTDYRALLAERPDVVVVSLPHGMHSPSRRS